MSFYVLNYAPLNKVACNLLLWIDFVLSGGIWLLFCNLTDYVGKFVIKFTATLAVSQATEVETNCCSNFKYSKSNIAATTQIT